MPPLQLLHATEENSGGKDCTLKDVDSEPEEIPPSPKTFKKPKGYYYSFCYFFLFLCFIISIMIYPCHSYYFLKVNILHSLLL